MIFLFRILVGVLVLCASCQHGLKDGVFAKGAVRYRIGQMPSTWRQVSFGENDLAFVCNSSPHQIAVNSTCEDHGDPPLSVLISHLLMGFTDRAKFSEEIFSLNDRDAIRSHYAAKLDGVPIELLLVVMKKNGCIYDFTYLSPPGRFDEQRSVFEQMVSGFATQEER